MGVIKNRLRLCGFLFFQAEDGIRDLVRSRGLGDVYKRQARGGPPLHLEKLLHATVLVRIVDIARERGAEVVTVSYTHLTLPTSDLV